MTSTDLELVNPVQDFDAIGLFADQSVEDSLANHFFSFVNSHAKEALNGLGLSVGEHLELKLSDHFDEGFIKQPEVNTVQVGIPRIEAKTALIRSMGFQWGNGMVIMPTLFSMVSKGIFGERVEDVVAGDRREVMQVARTYCVNHEKNLGVLLGALRLLGLNGWIELYGLDEKTSFALTPMGAEAVKALVKNRSRLEPVFHRLNEAVNYYSQVRADDSCTHADTHFLKSMAEQSKTGWDLMNGLATPEMRRANKHLNEFMDGVVLGPVLVALGMPQYTRKNDVLAETAKSVFTILMESQRLDFRDHPELNVEFVAACVDLLVNRGLAIWDSNNRHAFTLTEDGSLHASFTPPFLALTCSYYPSYQLIDSCLFANPDPLDIASDGHVDRVMNLYGSSGAGSGPASKVICEKILMRLFDELELNEQPAGLADMGCGDAIALKHLAQWVIDNTKRGQNLGSHPLYVIGADYNESSRSRARDTLAVLNQQPGVHAIVVYGDVTNPEEYNRTVCELDLQTHTSKGGQKRLELGDLVHTLMFLVHNRHLTVKDPSKADAILRESILEADRTLLERVLSEANQENIVLPEEPDELFRFVKSQFKTPYSDCGPLVPGYVVGADFVQFMKRWSPYTGFGMLAVESHCPWSEKMLEAVPEKDEQWLRSERLPIALCWGMHFISGQFLVPYEEYTLGMALAGYRPMDDVVHGNLFPEEIPSIDRVDTYRWLSIGCYQSGK